MAAQLWETRIYNLSTLRTLFEFAWRSYCFQIQIRKMCHLSLLGPWVSFATQRRATTSLKAPKLRRRIETGTESVFRRELVHVIHYQKLDGLLDRIQPQTHLLESVAPAVDHGYVLRSFA